MKRDTSGPLSHAEAVVSDVIGRLMEFWGFKRNMGRVWAVLYLSPDPLSADDLRAALQLSSGAVSMTLSELGRWGVVRRVWIQGQRRDFYAAEVALPVVLHAGHAADGQTGGAELEPVAAVARRHPGGCRRRYRRVSRSRTERRARAVPHAATAGGGGGR